MFPFPDSSLNAAWDTHYATLNEARPPTDDQPEGQKHVDWYLFRESMLGSVIKQVDEMVHSVSPTLKVAVWERVRRCDSFARGDQLSVPRSRH